MGTPIVSVTEISKSFGVTKALQDVSFDFYPGEIFAMVGANGAGKSTLIKIICGYYADYEGGIRIGGEQVDFETPSDALAAGIATVHQVINQGVIQTMSVAENLALADVLNASKNGIVYRKADIIEKARQIADRMELGHLDLSQMVAEISQSDRQLIAIARALATNPKMLILDEPTSSISERETEILFEKLMTLKAQGVCILYVSHRLHEIERIADRVGVIRDGCFGGVLNRPFQVKQIVTAMVGEVEDVFAGEATCQEAQSSEINHRQDRPSQTETDNLIELRDIVVSPGVPPLSLTLRPGEVVGLTGLIGAGKSELAQILFGLRAPVSGEIWVKGEKVTFKSVADAVEAGIFMVPEDRSNSAVIPGFDILQNMTLPFLHRFSSLFGFVRKGVEQKIVRQMITDIGVKCVSEKTDIADLSGGNQQKVIVGRWLLQKSHLLILDESYQGVDIRSRHDINKFIRARKSEKAILVLAADLDEILEVADRVIVMNHGKIVGSQTRAEIDRPQLLHWTSMAPEW